MADNPYLDVVGDVEAPQQASSGNPYKTMLQADLVVGTRQSIAQTSDINPDTDAKLQGLAQRYNIPVSAVRLDPSPVERRARIDAIDPNALVRSHPTTAGFLSDKNNAAIATDDTDNLKATEGAVKEFGYKDAAKKGALTFKLTWDFLADHLAGSLGFDQTETRNIMQITAAELQATGSDPRLTAAVKEAKIRGDDTWYGTLANLPGTVYEQDNPLDVIGLFFTEQLVGSLPGFGVGAAATAPLRGIVSSQVANQLVAKGVNTAIAGAAGNATAVVMQSLGSNYQEGINNGLTTEEAKKRAWTKTLAEVPANAIAGAAMGLRLGPNQLTNIIAQAGVQGAGGGIGAAQASQAVGEPVDSGEVALEILGEAVSAGPEIAGLSIDTIVTRARDKAREASQAEAGAEALTKMTDLAKASKVLQRNPQGFAQFVEQAAGEGAAQVYVNPKELSQAGVDVIALAGISPSVEAQLQTALDTGGDIAIPISEFTTAIGPTEFAQSLIEHARTDPQGMSRAEAQTYMQDQSAQLQAEVEKVLAEKQGDDTFKASRDVVYNELLTQLTGVNRFTADVNAPYANLVANFYAVQGARLGITPEEMFKRYPVKVQADYAPGPQLEMNQGSPYKDLEELQGALAEPENGGVETSMYENDNRILLGKIELDKEDRGQGYGTKAMQKIIEYADAHGKRIELTASTDFGGSSVKRLKDFYKRFGFVENKGKNKDFTTRETMIREPVKRELNQSQQAPSFYSALEKSLTDLPQGKGSAEQWQGIVKNLTQKGVKQEEIDWTGVQEWLGEQKGTVTKEQVLDYLKAHQVQVEEVVKGGDPYREFVLRMEDKYGTDWVNRMTEAELEEKDAAFVESGGAQEGASTKFDKYVLPGGENYRELLITLPQRAKTLPDEPTLKQNARGLWAWFSGDTQLTGAFAEWADAEAARSQANRPSLTDADNYKSSHYDEPNILAHLRFNERTDADGKRVMFIEEVQSDWHQAGREKGYKDSQSQKRLDAIMERQKAVDGQLRSMRLEAEGRDLSADEQATYDALRVESNDLTNQFYAAENKVSAVPDAPFKTSWPELAFKRALMWAVENNFDRVAWTTGEQQAERYDLSKQVDKIAVPMVNEGSRSVRIDGKDGGPSFKLMVDDNGVVDSSHSGAQFSGKKLDEVVGKEMADKIMKATEPVEFTGDGLKVGGEGMKSFYDKMLPSMVNKLVKKWGGKVGQTALDQSEALYKVNRDSHTPPYRLENRGSPDIISRHATAEEAWAEAERRGEQRVHSLDITPAMRESIAKGLPLFQGNDTKRGSFNPATSTITLLKAADLSTFLHEAGHFFLETLNKLALDPNAPPEIKADMDATLKWLGIEADGKPAGGSREGDLAQNTNSDAFKKWFGDSKVVDADGKPLVVYHGTEKGGFAAFDEYMVGENTSNATHGFYFTESRANAATYSGTRPSKDITNIQENVGEIDESGATIEFDPEAGIYPVYLSLQDPLVVDFEGRSWDGSKDGEYDGFDGMPEWENLAKQTGHDGVIAHNVTDEGRHGQGYGWGNTTYTAFSPTQIKSVNNRGTFDPNDPNILNQGDQPNTPTGAQPSGQSRLDVWNAMSLEEQRDYHEKFARGFEAYLFEGKSPSVEMQGVFQRFRAWLLNVYRSIRALNVELSDDIRSVFDRMLATSDQIKEAEALRNFEPLFKNPEDAGMTPEEFKAYHDLGVQATQDAITTLETRSLRDMQWLSNAKGKMLKKLQKDAEGKRKAIRREVTDEVMAEPVNQVREYLKTEAKLDTGAVREQYGAELPTGRYGLMAEGGLHPDVVADMFGFTSGDELIKELLTAEDPKQKIDGLTDQRMLERYGDLTDTDAMKRAADAAIHNEARTRFVATELNALQKATGGRKVLASAARQFAEAMVARVKMRDLKPTRYAVAEARAARAADKARTAGNLPEAAIEKRNQLVQGYAARAAFDAQEEIEKALRYLQKFEREGTRKNIDNDYLDQIDTLLDRFDLRKAVSLKTIEKRKSLAAWVESQREVGIEPEIDPAILNEALRKSYKDMTVEELRGLRDAVKQIEHIGRLKEKLLTAKNNREFKATVAELVASIAANGEGKRADNITRPTAANEAMRLFKGFFAEHRKVASLVRELDGFKDGGPMWEVFVRSMNEAGDKETTMREQATRKLIALVDPLRKGPKMGGKGQYFPSIGRSLNREERIGMALNTGNKGNFQRLLDGEGWTHEQVAPVLDTLTKEDWDFVQKVWDFFESYRPDIAAKEKRVYGKEPEWVEPNPVNTKFGEYRGGYYPIKYDPRRSAAAERFADAEGIKQQLQGAYTSATTRRSFTKSRAEEVVGRPLLLSMSGLYNGVNEVIHDLAWHEWLIDANRLLRSKSLDNAIRSRYGAEFFKQIKKAADDIATGDAPTGDALEKVLGGLRTGATVASMGLNIMNSVINVTGLTQSTVRIGPRWIAQGIAAWVASPVGLVKQVHEKSEFMRVRGKTQQREINEIRSIVQDKTRVREVMDRVMFAPVVMTQMAVDTPTWWGAYNKALAEGNAEDRAVALADQAVIDAQGSGMVKDLAAMQRGNKYKKLFTTFYSFFSTTYNLTVERTKATSFTDPVQVMKLAGDYLLLYSVPALMGTVLKSALSGGGDDEDELLKTMVNDQMGYMLGTVVGLRELTGAVQLAAGVNTFDNAYGGPAGLRFMQEFAKLGKQIGQGDVDRALLRAGINVAGITLHLPSTQINRTIDGIAALADGKTNNPMALIAGAPPKK